MISKQGQRDNDQRPVPGAKRHQAFDTDLIELRLSVSGKKTKFWKFFFAKIIPDIIDACQTKFKSAKNDENARH